MSELQKPAGEQPAVSEQVIPTPDPLVKDTPAVIADPAASSSVEILFDIEKAPEAVRKMRQDIITAASAGDLAAVAKLMKSDKGQTDIGAESGGGDPETALKDLSGDGEGYEILSILLDVLSTGYAHINAGTPEELYVWPYLAEKKLDSLTPAEKVDMMRIVTAGDFADMQEFGGYNFYRAGISPDGQWKFFQAGN